MKGSSEAWYGLKLKLLMPDDVAIAPPPMIIAPKIQFIRRDSGKEMPDEKSRSNIRCELWHLAPFLMVESWPIPRTLFDKLPLLPSDSASDDYSLE